MVSLHLVPLKRCLDQLSLCDINRFEKKIRPEKDGIAPILLSFFLVHFILTLNSSNPQQPIQTKIQQVAFVARLGSLHVYKRSAAHSADLTLTSPHFKVLVDAEQLNAEGVGLV